MAHNSILRGPLKKPGPCNFQESIKKGSYPYLNSFIILVPPNSWSLEHPLIILSFF